MVVNGMNLIQLVTDELTTWKGCFIITHLKDICKFDFCKDTSTLGSHSGGGGQKATYGLCVISTKLLPQAPARNLSRLLYGIRLFFFVIGFLKKKYCARNLRCFGLGFYLYFCFCFWFR